VVGMLGTHLARAHVGDLSTWKVGTTGYGGPGDLIDIVVVGSRIAVTDNGDVDYTDDYGDSWTDGGTPGAGPWEALGYFDGNYIIMKADSLKTDNNLAGTWTDRSSDIPASWAGVSPKKIVAAGTDVALILPVAMANPYSVLRTTDGTSFSEGGTFEPDSYLVDMAYNSALEQFLIVDAVGAIWTSDDGGVSWTKRRNGSTWTNETITCVAYYDQGYVFFSTDMAFATTDFNTFRRAFVATGPNSDPWTHAANVGYGTQDRKVLVSGGSGNKIFVRDSNWYSREDS
jgi:photosystem II stability/assembly factor-like uncharacterized protein